MDRFSRRIVWLLMLSFIITDCTNDPKPSVSTTTEDLPLFSLLSPLECGVDFSNNIEEDITKNITEYDYYYNGGGIAVGDINNDDLPDLFLLGIMYPIAYI